MASPSEPQPLLKIFHDILSKRRTASTLRSLTLTPPTSVDFSSNDFLSLSTSPYLRDAFLQELHGTPSFRFGSGGSRLLDGNCAYAERLERDIAAFHNAPAGLLFNSGYDANSGFFACVPQKGDVVVFDEFAHASSREGMRLSRAGRCVGFRHNSVEALREVLRDIIACDALVKGGTRSVFVAVESVYSMDGDLAPLREFVECLEEMLPGGNGYLVVDEAHATGVVGPGGRGRVCELGIEGKTFARLHTFGKALACSGDQPSLAALTAPPPPQLSLHLFALTKHLHTNLETLKPKCKDLASDQVLLHLPAEVPRSPIFSLLTPEPRSLARYCQDGGFMVRPIVSPTVPVGKERVRVCLHAGNTEAEIEGLVARIEEWLDQIRVGKLRLGGPRL
ncbi:hypothetical protein GP486_002307 [Trichoglossum hirsutum]|uniref:Aminotransferase class I/classII large domain-containing protein n=1 Tax=Trichoglossum hirsutum TaxID=265104 RepID=A0A9P8LFG4_9PEZI|nr:hypothetical protein GP486_002307 [Trichoglossum hirsutum]